MGYIRRTVGILIAAAGALPSYLIYLSSNWSEGTDLIQADFLAVMFGASGIAFLAFSVAQVRYGATGKSFAFGYVASYAAFIAVYLFAPGLGRFAERVMWLPVAVIFSVIGLFPVVGAAWLGSILVFGWPRPRA